jgi:two-component system phosphate regulon response regulator PhoB
VSKRILIIDDEPDILELVRFALTEEGYSVETASTASEGLENMGRRTPDLVVLDLMLPDMSGTDVCRTMRGQAAFAEVPVIMLTARAEEVDRVVGFELGADDYVTKPFSPRELVLRVKAVLRRGSPPITSQRQLSHGVLLVDLDSHRCKVEQNEVDLTAKEFGLLSALMTRPGRVLTRDMLLEQLWGSEITVTHRTVDTHLKRLREKLGEAGGYIHTVRGVGYRFAD